MIADSAAAAVSLGAVVAVAIVVGVRVFVMVSRRLTDHAERIARIEGRLNERPGPKG